MAEMYAVKDSDLTAIADAIRLKRESVAPIEVADMAHEIGLIDGGIAWTPMPTVTEETPIGAYLRENPLSLNGHDSCYILIRIYCDTPPETGSSTLLAAFFNVQNFAYVGGGGATKNGLAPADYTGVVNFTVYWNQTYYTVVDGALIGTNYSTTHTLVLAAGSALDYIIIPY